MRGATSSVLATDISPAVLEYARTEAERAGLTKLDVEPAAYDAVSSRVGSIYFPDRSAALAGIRRALRPGGRFATVTYSTPEAARAVQPFEAPAGFVGPCELLVATGRRPA